MDFWFLITASLFQNLKGETFLRHFMKPIRELKNVDRKPRCPCGGQVLTKKSKIMINNCSESRPSQKNEPLNPTELPERPWQKVGTDLCSRNNKEYLIAVDYYSL